MNTFPSTISPDKITGRTLEFNTKIVSFENEAEQRFPQWRIGKHIWEFSWNVMPIDDYMILENFFDGQMAQLISFIFTDQRVGGTRVIRFNADKLKPSEFINSKFVNVSIEVKEC